MSSLLCVASRRRLRFSLGFAVAGALLVLMSTLAMAQNPPPPIQPPPLHNGGVRWIGESPNCLPLSGWSARRLFTTFIPEVAGLCVYEWSTPGAAPPISKITELFNNSGATQLTEDVPVLSPMSPPALSGPELAFYNGLRTSLRDHVGTAVLLPWWPTVPRAARIVVVDTTPDAAHASIPDGESRHGDTLARLIEDIVCGPAGPDRSCAAEVTTALAMPLLPDGTLGPNGGHMGSLVDLARALERAVLKWEGDRLAHPRTTPPNLILNLSLGWEHNPFIADCYQDPNAALAPPARGVLSILQYAATKGALIFAAAGNDAGGSSRRSGLTCPGAYQVRSRPGVPSAPLLYAVAGLDYSDKPLETARPSSQTTISAIGLGGISWLPTSTVPQALTGSSVSTAVATAVAAVTWAFRPTWTAPQIAHAVHLGGVDLGRPADHCASGLSSCRVRRANVCGALLAAGSWLRCSPPPRHPWSSPALPGPLADLTAWLTASPSPMPQPPPPWPIPRFTLASRQVSPWVFPAPISVTCPTCWVFSASSNTTGTSQLAIPYLSERLLAPTLVLRLDDGTLTALSLGAALEANMQYSFTISTAFSIVAAYITGFDAGMSYSISEQLYVHR